MPESLSLLTGAGVDHLDLRRENAYLGVSFSMTKYFSRERMRQYVEWAGENLDNLLIIVADHFEGYNIEVFKNAGPEAAFPKAFGVGYQLLKNYVKSIPPALNSRVRIVLASELLIEDGCAEVLDLVKAVAARDAAFSRDCRAGILELLSGKLYDAGLRDQLLNQALAVLENYMFEEISIILYVAHVMSPAYPVAIFPYPPRKVIFNIYAGEYEGVFLPVTRSQPFRFIRLATPSFELASHDRE